MKLLVSIHDVMPPTLERVERIFDRLAANDLLPVMLLVVPGTGWSESTLERLRALLNRGGELAGHGWCHEARSIRGIKHRLHSALISRNAAEHLALPPHEIVDLMRANHAWFVEHDLPSPELYVPPAWAMGAVPRRALAELPFRRYETLAGVREMSTGRFHRLPMAGFEADTTLRAVTVGAFNAINRLAARVTGRPLRLGVHPDDFELKLADDLADMIAAGGKAIGYDAFSSRPA
ncbi:MAG: polysaccharide deacetylase family protein [Candidatus Wenzhouxiangella sp. M2_3B_020]